MKKVLSNPKDVLENTLAGVLKAYPNDLRMAEGSRHVLVQMDAPIKDKVGIATGGGLGHIPAFLGYVGPGLADSVAIGSVFSSPSAEDMLIATKAADGGAGILHLYDNYSDYVMAFGVAAEMAEMAEGIRVKTVLSTDDVASGPPKDFDRRRGIAGIFFIYKIAGAKADRGASLDEVAAVARRAVANTRSIGIARSPFGIPKRRETAFSTKKSDMVVGMGIHGEHGTEKIRLKSAGEIAEVMSQRVLQDLPYERGSRVAVLVNSFGATSREELFILFNTVYDRISSQGIDVYRTYVGEYATAMDMQGCSLSLLNLDAELKELLDAPAYSPFLLQWR